MVCSNVFSGLIVNRQENVLQSCLFLDGNYDLTHHKKNEEYSDTYRNQHLSLTRSYGTERKM